MCAIKYRKSCELRGTWHGFEGNTEASTLEGARLEKKLVDDFQALENQEFDTFNSEYSVLIKENEEVEEELLSTQVMFSFMTKLKCYFFANCFVTSVCFCWELLLPVIKSDLPPWCPYCLHYLLLFQYFG